MCLPRHREWNEQMKPSELLKQKGWTQDAYARDKNGEPIGHLDCEATCFCALGAIKRCYGISDGSTGKEVFNILSKYLGFRGKLDNILIWNDSKDRSAEQVISAFEAIGQ